MTFLDVTHVAVNVRGPIRDAERYYCDLFDLQVSWREPVPGGAPFDTPWNELDAAGVVPEIVMLHAGALRLSVIGEGTSDARGNIEHVGLQVTPDHLVRVRDRALAAGLEVVFSRGNELFDFIDQFGVEWELDTRSFADPLAIVLQKREREAAQESG